jgi:hypothetical protein
MVRIEETVVGTGPVVPRLSNVIAAADYSVWLQKGYSPIKLGGIHAVAALLPTIPHFLLNVMILHYHPGKGPPSPGAWPSSYSGFGSAAGAASAGTAVTAGASSAGGASTAGSAGSQPLHHGGDVSHL